MKCGDGGGNGGGRDGGDGEREAGGHINVSSISLVCVLPVG